MDNVDVRYQCSLKLEDRGDGYVETSMAALTKQPKWRETNEESGKPMITRFCRTFSVPPSTFRSTSRLTIQKRSLDFAIEDLMAIVQQS
jgi:hypothetical protein